MELMDNVEKLSNIEYWDNVLKNAKLPLIVKTKHYSTWLLNNFFAESIEKGHYNTLIEVGAGSSAWLPFLAKNYDLIVSCLDYSEVGCRLCKENLNIQKIPYHDILHQDLLEWNDDRKYDILVSFGVIEHFDNPGAVVNICRQHVNQNGLIITVIPNLSGFPGWIGRKFVPGVYDMHKNISLGELISYHESNGFQSIKADYTGFFYPMLIPWASKKNGLLGFKFLREPILKMMEILNLIVSRLLVFLKISGSFRYFSPFLVYVGKVPVSDEQ